VRPSEPQTGSNHSDWHEHDKLHPDFDVPSLFLYIAVYADLYDT